MHLRRLGLLALAAVTPVLALAAVTVPATAGTPTDYTVPDNTGDAPAAVDIVKVRVYPTASAYRATVTYTDLRPQKANRWLVTFGDLSGSRRGGPSTGPTGNVAELRITPGGKMSTKAWDYYSSDDSFTETSCAGLTATPNWNTNRIAFVIPASCWNLSSGGAYVSAAARHYTPSEGWSTNPYDAGSGTKSDTVFFSWNYGGS